MSARRLIALYPRRWRERYGEELEGLLEGRRPAPRLVVDLMRGALDAHLHQAEILPEPPERALRGAAGALVQALAVCLLALAAVTKASEDTATAGAALDAARVGSGLAVAAALALGVPTALALLRARERRLVVRLALPPFLFLGATLLLSALAPSPGSTLAFVSFWTWACGGALATAAAARAGGSALRALAPVGALAGLWPAAWMLAAGAFLTLAGVTAWSLSAVAADSGVALGGLPAVVVAAAGTLACVVAAALVWRCVRAGQHARAALIAGR